jgi:hypothetical protein
MNGISPLPGQLLLSQVDPDGLLFGLAALVLIVAVGALMALVLKQQPRPAAS